jgi:hypothetical protein
MDVHTPQAAPRGWRAFLREYLIIVIGVLTALAAEQSVGWLHRYQTRRQLEKDLLEEMRMNDGILRDDLQGLTTGVDWAFHEAETIQAAVQAGNIASLRGDELKRPTYFFSLPNDSVWQHAKESGAAALLPREVAEAYTTLFRIRERLVEFAASARAATTEFTILRTKAARSRYGSPDLSQLSASQLDDLASALLRMAVSNDTVKGYISAILANHKVLESGSTSDKELFQSFKDAFAAARQQPTPTPAATPATRGEKP